MGREMESDNTKQSLRRIVSHLKGCSSHDCVVNGPKADMGAGMCKCISDASRFELTILENRIKSILNSK